MTVATDLADEMIAAAGSIRQQHLDLIRRLGVSGEALAKVALATSLPAIGVVEAERLKGGRWQPGAGPAHLVQPVVHDGEVIDIIAWRSLRPHDWVMRRDATWALGEGLLERGGWQDDPLIVHATPLDWLVASGDGLCILDWKAPEIRLLLQVDEIEVSVRAFGDVLVREISRPPRVPKLTIKRGRDVA